MALFKTSIHNQSKLLNKVLLKWQKGTDLFAF